MFFCDLADERIEDLKQGWGEIGDSIVVVGGDGLWNCHVHTNDIGAAIETALDLDGRPRQIRVTDLFEEIAAEHAHREAGDAWRRADRRPPSRARSSPSAAGRGSPSCSASSACRPSSPAARRSTRRRPSCSTAVDAVPADQVVVLPGNKNIIPVAEQLDALTAKTVRVVPTRSMPEGLAALMVYDPEAPAEANVAAMRQAAEAIATGEVTQAVRASQTDAGPVAEGDWIGIVRGDGIVAVARRRRRRRHRPARRTSSPTSASSSPSSPARTPTAADTAAVEAWLADERPGVEVEVHDGGQPLYPYLFGVE